MSGPGADAKRVAFVVGINKYENLGPDLQLAKAVADARAIADTVASLGFQVVKGENTKRNAFFQAWQRCISPVVISNNGVHSVREVRMVRCKISQ